MLTRLQRAGTRGLLGLVLVLASNVAPAQQTQNESSDDQTAHDEATVTGETEAQPKTDGVDTGNARSQPEAIFIPSESVSADSAVAFPVDI